MTADDLRALQAPLKAKYRDDPDSAMVTMTSRGTLNLKTITCEVDRRHGDRPAGLHPAAGGDGSWGCSGEMLLDSLVACAGVTLCAVATAMGIAVRSGEVRAEGDLDFRGTLGIDRSTPVGLSAIRLKIALEADATSDQLATLLKLTERYCVIYQTLVGTAAISAEIAAN